MTNLATKLFLALTGAALVAAIGYGVVVGDRAGADLILALAGGFAVVTAVTALAAADDKAPAVAADAPAPERRGAYTEADAPTGSAWPLVAALTAVALAFAVASGASWLAVALAASVIPAAGWLAFVWQQHPSFSARVRERVVERLLAPIAMPVLAALGALFMAAMVSRLLLAISATASWITALGMAGALLLVLAYIAARPRLTGSALLGLAAVSVLSMVAVGAIGAKAGERTWEPHESEIPLAKITAHNLQFSLKTIQFPANHDIDVKFRNLDLGVYHNVAFYTSADPDRKPLFNGKPVPRGLADYRARTPGPGTYAFLCDFHPTTMVGTLVVIP
jgi:plastocyanin